MQLIRIVISRVKVRLAVGLIHLGWTIIGGERRRFGWPVPSSIEPAGAWLEVQWW